VHGMQHVQACIGWQIPVQQNQIGRRSPCIFVGFQEKPNGLGNVLHTKQSGWLAQIFEHDFRDDRRGVLVFNVQYAAARHAAVGLNAFRTVELHQFVVEAKQ